MQSFPDIFSSPELNRFHLLLTKSKHLQVSKPALMLAVEKILPLANVLLANPIKSFQREQKIVFNLLMKQDPDYINFLNGLSPELREQMDKFVALISSTPANIIEIFKKSSLEMTQYIYQTIHVRFPKEKMDQIVKRLKAKLSKIALSNADLRVFPYLVSKIEASDATLNHDVIIRSTQSYLNHVAFHQVEQEELFKRITQIKDVRVDLPRLLFNGEVDQDPILKAIYHQRWGLVTKMLRLLSIKAEGQKIAIYQRGSEENSFYLFCKALITMPWKLYSQFREHYLLPSMRSDGIFEIWHIARTNHKLDRRVLMGILGHSRPFGLIDIPSGQMKKQKSLRNNRDKSIPNSSHPIIEKVIDELFQAFDNCMSYQLFGWLLETFGWLHRLFDVQGHLSRLHPNYRELSRIQQFSLFLQFFKHCIEEERLINTIEEYRSNKRKMLPEDIVEAVKVRFAEIVHHPGMEILRRNIDWILQYLVPHVKQHPDIQNVILFEASESFINSLVEDNPSLNLK